MQNNFICPITNKRITYHECFDISMVVEDLAPENTIDDNIKPFDIDKCKDECMKCPKHPK